MKKLLVMIPAYNEAQIIGKVLSRIPKRISGIQKIDTVVIDDGSLDKTSQVARKFKIYILRHLINRGLGATLATGFEYAKQRDYDFVITFDADGQHDPRDIRRIISPLLKKNIDVVVGSRLLQKHQMPFFRWLVNYLSNIYTYLLFNIWTSDSQSGLRAFSEKAYRRFTIRSQGMEVSSEIFREIRKLNLHFVEVPIQAIYTNYSLHKGQRLTNAPNIVLKLMLQEFPKFK